MDTTTTGKIITANAETAKVMNGNAVVWSGEEDILLYEFYDYEIPNSPYFIQAEDTNKYYIDVSNLPKVGRYLIVRDKSNVEINGFFVIMAGLNIENMDVFISKLTDKYVYYVVMLKHVEKRDSSDGVGVKLNNPNTMGKNYIFKLKAHYDSGDATAKEEDLKAITEYLKDK